MATDVRCVLRAACSKPQSYLSHTDRYQLEEAAQAEARPVCAGNGGTGQDEKDDKDDHSAATASAGTAPSEAEALLQPIKGSGQQKELKDSLQTALTVSHGFPFQTLSLPSNYLANISPTDNYNLPY
jgi:hypothetical protein